MLLAAASRSLDHAGSKCADKTRRLLPERSLQRRGAADRRDGRGAVGTLSRRVSPRARYLVMHILVLFALSRFVFWPSPLDWQMPQENVAIRGVVIDETSGRGIAGAIVYAVSDADIRETTSDSNGHFIFLTLLPGGYRLCASKYAYVNSCYPLGSQPEELFAGFEYGATIILSHAID